MPEAVVIGCYLLCLICVASQAKHRASALIPRLTFVLSITMAVYLPISLSLVLPKPDDWLSHSRLRELCFHRQGGHEGKVIKEFKLLQAFIITTPGLQFREGENDLDSRSSRTCMFKSFSKRHPSARLHNYEEILDYKSALKEGDQKAYSAFRIFSPVPSSRQCKSGMMTSLGIAQSVWLGEYFSLAYHKLWSIQKRMAVARTVGDEVLYQTASAVLYGLLHEKQFVKNHVKKMSVNYSFGQYRYGKLKDKLKVKEDIKNDHVHHFVQSSFEKEHYIFKDKSSPTAKRDKIEDIAPDANISAKNILSLSALKFCPENKAKTANPTQQTSGSKDKRVDSKSFSLSHILSLSDTHNKYLSNETFFQSYSDSRTLPLRKFLRAWALAAKSKQNPEINLVTVDELFLLSLLTSFNRTTTQHIPPVSRLVFEKFAFNSSSQENTSKVQLKRRQASDEDPSAVLSSYQNLHNQFFRVLLNGKVITREIGTCGSDPMISLGLCSSLSVLSAFDVKRYDETSAVFRDEL